MFSAIVLEVDKSPFSTPKSGLARISINLTSHLLSVLVSVVAFKTIDKLTE